jgi:hypothetical protein
MNKRQRNSTWCPKCQKPKKSWPKELVMEMAIMESWLEIRERPRLPRRARKERER